MSQKTCLRNAGKSGAWRCQATGLKGEVEQGAILGVLWLQGFFFAQATIIHAASPRSVRGTTGPAGSRPTSGLSHPKGGVR